MTVETIRGDTSIEGYTYVRPYDAIEYKDTPLLPDLLNESVLEQYGHYIMAIAYDSDNRFEIVIVHADAFHTARPFIEMLEKAHFEYKECVEVNREAKQITRKDADENVLQSISKATGADVDGLREELQERKEFHDRKVK